MLNLTKRLYYKVIITTKYPNIFGTFFKAFSKKINHIDNTFFFEKNYMWKKMVFQNVFFMPSCIQSYLTSNLGNKKLKGDFNPMHVRDIACEQ